MNLRISLMLIAVSIAAAPAGEARAELLRGTVISSNADNGSIVVRRAQTRRQGPDRVRIFSDEATRFVGIDSLGELEAGAEVFVDADRAGGNSYQADQIRSAGASAGGADRSEQIRSAAYEVIPPLDELDAERQEARREAGGMDYSVQDRPSQHEEPYRF